MDRKSQEWRQYFIACIAISSVFTSCYAMGWTAPIIIKLRNPEESPLPNRITVDEESWIGSLVTIGAIIGPYVSGLVIGKLGRKWALVCTSLPMLMSWFLMAVSTNLPMIYAARVIAGFYVGMSLTVCTLYLAEIATTEHRGAVNTSLGVGMNSGYLLVYSIGPFVSFATVAYIGIILSALNLILSLLAPESPYYYLAKGDVESAGSVLMKLRGKNRSEVEPELEKLCIEVKKSVDNTAKFSDIFRGNNRSAVLLSCGLMMIIQLSGIGAVLFYMTNIFEAAGTRFDSAISTIIIGVIQTVLAFCAPLIIDRLGRKTLLIVSLGGTAFALTLLGTYFYLDEAGNPIVQRIGFLPLLCLVVIVATHVIGLGPVILIYMAEVMPAEARSSGMSIVMANSSIMSFLVTRYFGPLAQTVGMGASFWIFAACCLVSIVCVWLFIPETRGKSFYEIQHMLRNR